MRKRIITQARAADAEPDGNWLDLEKVASVEVTSEAEGFPVEGALLKNADRGWRAATPGVQTIRLFFDNPIALRRARLVFKEEHAPRTQEFVLRWLPQGTEIWKDILRQQWNFSPPDNVEEREQYQMELASAAAFEVSIRPDISNGDARASLEKLQLSQ